MIKLSFLIILFCGFAYAKEQTATLSGQANPKAIRLNEQGIVQYKAGNFSIANGLFIQALGQSPFSPELHLNLGLSFEGLQQPEKAQKSYDMAIQLSQEEQIRFASLYNKAQLLAKLGERDEALKFYQEALKINPESLEIKTNIELLTKDNENDKNKQDNKDNKDDKENKDGKDNKDQNDKNDDQNKDQNKDQQKDENKKYAPNKPQPQKFKSENLSEQDVKKILGEIRQQEQKIRAEFNKKEVKEKSRDKDW